MNMLRSENARTVLTLGLLSGAFILFTGAVGMIAAFHEREVVNDVISLGQLLLLLAPFAAGSSLLIVWAKRRRRAPGAGRRRRCRRFADRAAHRDSAAF